MADSKQVMAMRKLGLTDEEIQQMLKDDKAIDKGEKMDFDLTPEQAKVAKKYTNTGTRKQPTVYNFDTTNRKRKENPTKASIIS